MQRQLFVNLPIREMARSQAFYRALGFDFDPRFTNDQGACVVVAGNIFVMLLVEPFFAGFTHLPVADARRSTQVLLALSCEDRAEVDERVRRALAAGGSAPNPPRDLGFMYQHGFADPDGHLWEVFHMDMAAAPAPA